MNLVLQLMVVGAMVGALMLLRRVAQILETLQAMQSSLRRIDHNVCEAMAGTAAQSSADQPQDRDSD